MTAGSRRAALLLAACLALTVAAPCRKPAAKAGLGRSAEQVRSLLDKGRYEQALKAATAGLKKARDNPDFGECRVRALLGLGRYMDAARTSLRMAAEYPGRPVFRFLAGESAYHMGMVPQAVMSWSALFKDKAWGDRACRRAVLALRAAGQDRRALDLLKNQIAAGSQPSLKLLKLELSLTLKVEDGLKLADRLIERDPSGRSQYAAMKALFRAAGSGSLLEAVAPASLPVTIPVKEKSEFRDLSSLSWGTVDWYSGTSRLSSTTQIVVPCSIDGSRDMPVIFDTGSNVALISSAWAGKLGLKPVAIAEYEGMGIHGAQRSHMVLLKEVEVGPVTIRNVPALVMSSDGAFFKKIGGIIPLSLLKDYALHYDRRHGKLVLYESGTPPASVLGQDADVVKSLWPSGRPFVQVSINGRRGLYCMVDTGASTTQLAMARMAQMGVSPNTARYPSPMGTGTSGEFSSGVAENVKLTLGRTRFNMRTVLLANIGKRYQLDCYGILGRRDVLDLLDMFFDYKANVIAFVPYDR